MPGIKDRINSIKFPVDTMALWKDRSLAIARAKWKYDLPVDPIYEPARRFIGRNIRDGYKFKLISVLHAAGVKMMQDKIKNVDYDTMLFATGGLYLALDPFHESLGLRRALGDFSSGFAHQFGVALAVMTMSDAYRIPWDLLEPIPVKGKKVLDYQCRILNNTGWLQLEAKGVSSEKSQASARADVRRKKKETALGQTASPSAAMEPTAMIGVITRAGRTSDEMGEIEIIDPEFVTSPEARQPDNQMAAQFMHYASVAHFAGLSQAARHFYRCATAITDDSRLPHLSHVNLARDSVTTRFNRQLIGVRWRFGDTPDDQEGVWFYQAMEIEKLSAILEHNQFSETHHFDDDWFAHNTQQNEQIVESLLPDGSYFGIGIGKPIGFRETDPRDRRNMGRDLVEVI